MRALWFVAMIALASAAWGEAEYFDKGEMPVVVCEGKSTLACNTLDDWMALMWAYDRGTWSEEHRDRVDSGRCRSIRRDPDPTYADPLDMFAVALHERLTYCPAMPERATARSGPS